MPPLKIAPSILSADFGKLNSDIETVERFSNLLHVDVMDGHFVPNITIGPMVISKIKSTLPLDCHLMIDNPEDFIKDFVKAGASIISVHAEVLGDKTAAVLAKIKEMGVEPAVAINPGTPLSKIEGVLDNVSMVLLMSVNPGFAGQGFMAEVLPKIRKLRELKPELDIEVDGGINAETVKLVKEAGANVIVAGSYIFGAEDREAAIKKLRE